MKKIQVLGTQKEKNREMSENAETAAKELGVKHEIETIDDASDIINFGRVLTPALAVNGEVKISGKVPSVEEIRNVLSAKPRVGRR